MTVGIAPVYVFCTPWLGIDGNVLKMKGKGYPVTNFECLIQCFFKIPIVQLWHFYFCYGVVYVRYIRATIFWIMCTAKLCGKYGFVY